MCFKLAVLALTCLGGLAAQPVEFKQRRQVGSPAVSNGLETAESGSGNPLEAVHAGSKYFQYVYVPAKDNYQHGHWKGNDHFVERNEEADPYDGESSTKIRWGDKNGGYGEHYYDFNHDGHQQGDGGEQTETKPQYVARQAQQSDEQPKYISYGVQARQESISVPAYQIPAEATQRGKREQGLLKDVEFINDRARSLILDGNSQQHGGNYRRADDYRGKREQHVVNEEDLVFESDKGTFLDQRTGIEYELRPLYR